MPVYETLKSCGVMIPFFRFFLKLDMESKISEIYSKSGSGTCSRLGIITPLYRVALASGHRCYEAAALLHGTLCGVIMVAGQGSRRQTSRVGGKVSPPVFCEWCVRQRQRDGSPHCPPPGPSLDDYTVRHRELVGIHVLEDSQGGHGTAP